MRKPILCLTTLLALCQLNCSRISFVNPNGPRISSRSAMPREMRERIREEREKEEAREHYDQASKAADYYNMQRVPPGEDSIPTDRYQKAVDHERLMNRYESVTRTILPSEASMSRESLKAERERSALGQWTFLGPSTIGGRTRAIVFHPTQPGTMYAGAVSGGVWRSTDSGQSWSPLTDLLSSLSVNSLAIDPANPTTLYAGTGEVFTGSSLVGRGVGIFKSVDGGETWNLLPGTRDVSSFFFVSDIVVSPVNSQRVYAATIAGIMRSLDGGNTWTRVHQFNNPRGCTDLIIRADGTRDYMLAGCGVRAPGAIFLNQDAGGSGQWVSVLTNTSMGRVSLSFAPSNPTMVYAVAICGNPSACGDFVDGLLAVYRSPNGGVAGSWETRVDNRNSNILNRILFSDSTSAVCDDNVEIRSQGDYDNVIAVDPSDPEIVWVGGIDLWRSDDGGKNWGQASYWWASPPILSAFAPTYAHADNHVIAFHPQYNGTSNQIMFVGNDGGIQRTNNAKAATAKTATNVCRTSGSQVTFARVNNNYSVTQFYNGAALPDGTGYFGGTQDNGTNLGNDGTGPAGWRVIHGGDGGFVAVNPTNPDVLYAETPQLAIVKSTDRGLRFSKVTSGIREPNENFLFIAPFTMDPTNPERLFIGARTLWRTDNGAQFWTAASRPITIAGNFAAISAIAISPSNPGRVAVGTTEGFVHRMDGALSSTEATNWTLISKPRDGFISWLAFDPNNDRVLYATYSTFNFTANAGHVFRSVDAGATWTSIDGSGTTGIPDIPVLNILPDPANAGRLFVGSDVGVFVSEDSGATWLRENTGFANAVTQTLTVNAGTPKSLFAFTHGRGVWKVPLGTTSTCNYSINGSPSAFPSSGGQGSINVTTASGCAWEAKADASFITITSGASGDGAGRIAFSVAVNDTQAERTGRITVANQVFVVTQSALDCRYTVAPLTLTFNANGGTSSVRVTAPAGCVWTAVSNISFLNITSGASGSSDGTVNIAAQSNPLGTSRTGTLTVAGQSVNATQAGRQPGTGGAFDELSTSTRIENFPFTGSFDTSIATSNGNDPRHSCTGDRDSNTVWFRFIPNFTGPLQVTTVGSTYDTVLAVYDNGNNEIACNDDLSRTVFQSSVTVQVSAFQNYVIQVSGYGPSNPGGTMQLTISANDQIAAATPIATVPFTFNQDTRYATVVEADPIHSCTRQKDAKSVWFRVQPNFTGRLMADTVGSTYDTVLAAYAGTVPQQDIACSDDASDSLLSSINFAVTSGQTYLLQVTSYSSGGPGGQLRLNVANNDTPAFAQAIGTLPNFLEQSTAGATVSPEDVEQTCSQERTGRRAWFRYTSNFTGRVQVATRGSLFDTVLTAHLSNNGVPGPALACNDDVSDTDVSSQVSFNVTNGQTYLIQVGSYGLNSLGGILRMTTREDVACSYALAPASADVPATGGRGTIRITTTAGCTWNVASDQTWISFDGVRSGTGAGTVNWVATTNSATDARGATISIGGQSFTISQEGAKPGLPDLVVAAVNAPDVAVVGDTFEPSFVVGNIGRANAPEFEATMYFSTDNKLSPDDTPIDAVCTIRAGLPPGSGVRCSGKIQVPSLAAGDYFFLVVVDEQNQVEEDNEDNNVGASQKPVALIVATVSVEERKSRLTLRGKSAVTESIDPGRKRDREEVIRPRNKRN